MRTYSVAEVSAGICCRPNGLPRGRNRLAERSLSRPDPEQEALTNLTPHKAMLLVADPEDGRLLPEYRDEWESQLSPLSVGCRLALWWPDYQEGQVLSPEQR